MIKKTRASDRDLCFIRAFANNHTGQVRDITSRGMRIALFGQPEIIKGDSINVKIIPDESEGIDSFYIRGTVRWVKRGESLVNFGLHYTDEANMSALLPLKKILEHWE